MFTLGDKAFYPAHGVGVIEGIESRRISGVDESYYVLRIIDSGMKVTVPRSRVSDIGLRPLVSSEKAEEVFLILTRKEADSKVLRTTLPWNRRQRDYNAKLKTGSIFDLAEILKELSALQNQKPLSFGEKKLMETVRKLITKELACCQNCSEDSVCGKINSLLMS